MPYPEVVVAELVEPRRRRWPWLLLAVFSPILVVCVLAAVGIWRLGWPERPWETTTTHLGTIGWEEAVRLEPQCIRPGSTNTGARNVYLANGTLDRSGKAVFDATTPAWVEPVVVEVCREVLPELRLPGLKGKQFKAGLFWVDMPAGHGAEGDAVRDPTEAYSVLLMCPESRPWEKASKLIVDLNRNRDLTDDPVMTLSKTWSHDGTELYSGVEWKARVFQPVTLTRAASDEAAGGVLPATVEAIPALSVLPWYDGNQSEEVYLAFCPTSFRRGQIDGEYGEEDLLIGPDETRLGRFDGPSPCVWNLSDDFEWDGWYRPDDPLTMWSLYRGAFWGKTLSSDGQKLFDGPYEGALGKLTAEAADGTTLEIGEFRLWRGGDEPHMVMSYGWAPVPRFSSLAFPVDEQSLPIGDYGISSIRLTDDTGCAIDMSTANTRVQPTFGEFSIEAGETTQLRLPKTLEMEAIAKADDDYQYYDWVWLSDSAAGGKESTVFQPGRQLTLSFEFFDPATGNQYEITPSGNDTSQTVAVAIKDASGRIVQRGTMEYG